MKRLTGKTLLIVGAGFGQLPAIKKAMKLGLQVVVVDKNPNAPGMSLAHHAYAVDVLDKTGVLNIAKKHGVHGVVTMQTDLPMPTIGSINDELGLKGISFKVAINCSHKMETRKLLKTKKIPQPIFQIVTNYAETCEAANKIGFPVMVKSVDSSGSRGVSKVYNLAEIEDAFDEALKYTRQREILVEEYIPGIELGAQAFSIGGKCKLVLLHNDTVANSSFMVPKGHSFPCKLPAETIGYVESVVKQCVEALGIHEGPSNIDLILNENGEVRIIEVGARIGATCLPELLEYFSGIDWVKETIMNTLGQPNELNQNKNQACAAVILEAPNDGLLNDIVIPSEVLNNENLLEIEITEKIGAKVSKLRKGTDRIGKIVVKGANAHKAENLAEKLKKKVSFNVLDEQLV